MREPSKTLVARHRPSTRHWGVLAAAAVLTLAGCAVGPDFKTPTAPVQAGYAPQALPAQTASADVHGGAAQRFVQGMDLPGQWWTLFRSPQLNALVEQALVQNPDVAAARAALRSAHEQMQAQRGAYLPSVDASYSAARQLIPDVLASPASSGADLYSLQTAQLSIAYTPDFFGANRRQVESLVAQEDAQRFTLEATYLTLSSNVVAAAIGEASLRGQLAATQQIIDSQRKSLALIERRRALGDAADADVAAQQAALAQAQAALPPLQKQLAQQRDLLARLLGRFPSEPILAKFDLASLALPVDLPVSLPSKLVEQRPDVRAAQAEWQAANAAIGIAKAARFPNVSITANYGSNAATFAELFGPGTAFWGIAANITQPIFQGGTLLHRQRAAEAAAEQAAAQYRGTVLTAFQNVADTLHALRSDADALASALAAQQAAAHSLQIAQRQLALGDIGNLAWFAAEQTDQQARINLVLAQANRYSDTAALFQALGGGWWHRDDARPPAAHDGPAD